MSQSTNSNVKSVNFCDVCNLSFETKKGLSTHQSYDPKHKELLEKMFDSDLDEAITEASTKTEASTITIEKMYDSDGDFIYVKPSTKTETKDIIKTKTKPDDSLYTIIKFECKECHDEFRSKVAPTTPSYSHNCMYLEKTEDFDINSSQNMREFYITDKGGNYIEDIDKASNYSLEDIKNCYQFEKVRVLNDLKNSKSILNIRSYKYNCLQQTITAWLDPAMDPRSGFGNHATPEGKYVNNLIEARQPDEDDFAYITRIQKLYNINIWVYTPFGGGKVELFKPVDDFDKDRKDVRILVWGDVTTEHCALIKNIETLLDRPNRMNHKFYYCNRSTYWFDSQIKYDKHECNNSFKPENVCPRKKKIIFINEHKRQNIKNVITADIECCIVEVATYDCKYVIAENIPISVGYFWQGNFKYYFHLHCIKRFISDLSEIETENNFKRNKQMIFNEEDKFYHEINNTCHICSKTCIYKVRDHCHETGKYREPACKICNLRYKQQNFIPVIFHNGSGYDFNLLYSELFMQNNDNRKVDNIPLAAGKSKTFSFVCLKISDSRNFLAMPLDQLVKIYGCKTKTLCPYEYFGLDTWGTTTKSYQEVIGNLNIEHFKPSLSNNSPTQEEVDSFNKDNSHKTFKNLTIEYLQNDVEILDHCMNEYVKLSMKEFGLNPLHYVSLPCYRFDCWLMSSGVSLDTLQDKKKC